MQKTNSTSGHETRGVINSLDSIKPDSDYVLLNNWMCVTEDEAKSQVEAARAAKDLGVFAVPFKQAIAAPAMLALLKQCERAMFAVMAPEKHHLPLVKAIADVRSMIANLEDSAARNAPLYVDPDGNPHYE